MIDQGIMAKTGSAWLTYCALRRHVNPRAKMTAQVDFEQLSADTGFGIEAVRKQLSKLKTLGLIESWVATRKGGGRRLLVRILTPANGTQIPLADQDQRYVDTVGGQRYVDTVRFNEQTGDFNGTQIPLGSTSPTETRANTTAAVSSDDDPPQPAPRKKDHPADAPEWVKGASE